MTKAARALVLLTFLGVCATGASSEVRFKSYYSGIPDYESTTVFQAEPARSHLELRAAVRNAVTATVLCVRGQVKATVVAPHVFTTNICDPSSYSAIKTLLARLAPSLDPSRLGFRKVDLDEDGEPELLIEYVDLIGDDQVKDPYLSLWILRYDGTRYRPAYVGPFVVGQVWAQMPFGQTRGRTMVFVRHQNCTECHPWVYVSVVDFLRTPNGAMFAFSYAGDHKEFGHTIEYILPGMGHSVDAKVETRVLPPGAAGPHLVQQFRLADGNVEWWLFRCNDLKCDFEMSSGKLPAKHQSAWQSGKRL